MNRGIVKHLLGWSRLGLVLIIFAIAVLPASTCGAAMDFGANITLGPWGDGYFTPGCVGEQVWDLEGMFLKGNTLTLVGGYNFRDGQSDSYWSSPSFLNGPFRSGDIWIDTKNLNGSQYDMVLTLDMASLAYKVYAIGSYGVSSYNPIYFESYPDNKAADPWTYVIPGGVKPLASGNISFVSGLTDADTGFTGGNHYALSVDLSSLAGKKFFAHYTYQCGNDQLNGIGTPVPIPPSVFLLAPGLLGLLGVKMKLRPKPALASA